MPPKKHANVKKDAPPPLPSRDHFERAHFAVQASVYLQQLVPGLGTSSSAGAGTTPSKAKASAIVGGSIDMPENAVAGASTSTVNDLAAAGPAQVSQQNVKSKSERKSKRRRSAEVEVPFAPLARAMGNVKPWTVHNQVKIDPTLKRAFCANCSTVLVPGLTSRVRIRPSKHAHKITHTCLQCSTTLAIPAAPTSVPEDGVDDPVRAKRRGKLLRGVVFHEREADGAAGHVLWRGNEKVRGWGVEMPAVAGETDGANETKEQAQAQTKGQKQQQKQKQQQPQPQNGKNNQHHRQKHVPVAEEQDVNMAFDEEEAANNM